MHRRRETLLGPVVVDDVRDHRAGQHKDQNRGPEKPGLLIRARASAQVSGSSAEVAVASAKWGSPRRPAMSFSISACEPLCTNTSMAFSSDQADMVQKVLVNAFASIA